MEEKYGVHRGHYLMSRGEIPFLLYKLEEQQMIKFNSEYKVFKCYNMRVAGELMIRGFICFDIEKSVLDSRKNAYIFKNTEQLVEVFNSIMERKTSE